MQSEYCSGIFIKSILAGIVIGIGGIVYLLTDNRYMGSFLFSLGLFTILRYGLALYTGKVGYIPERKPAYLTEVALTLAGNTIGTGLSALFIRLTKVGLTVHTAASSVMTAKMEDAFISRLVLGFFCGLLMFIAVDNGNRCKQEKNDVSFLFGTVVPVMVFILCGFNHSIADCFYVFASISTPGDLPQCLLYLLTVVIGNALGGMLFPFCKMLSKRSDS